MYTINVLPCIADLGSQEDKHAFFDTQPCDSEYTYGRNIYKSLMQRKVHFYSYFEAQN